MDEETQGLLESDHPGQRVQGLRLVALVEDRDAGDHALGLLARDSEPEVREHAARAVAALLGSEALSGLAAAAHGDADPLVRRTCLALLGEIGDRRAAARLAELVPRAASEDRGTALEALRACGDATRASVAAEQLPAEGPLRAVALHAYAALATGPVPDAVLGAARKLLGNGPTWVVPAAARLTGDAPDRLLRGPLAGARGFERERVALRSLELDPATASAVLREVLAAPERAAEDRPAALLAARELARRGDGAGAPLLARTVYDADARGQLEAALALAELGSTMGEPYFRRAFAHAPAHERPYLARGLALCGRLEGTNALGALLSSDVPQDRRYSARALAELGRRDGVVELVRSLDHPFRRERDEALAALRALWREGPRVDVLAPSDERAPHVAAWARHFGVAP